DKTTEIDALTYADTNGRVRQVDEALYDTYTDGIVVLHVDASSTSAILAHLSRTCRMRCTPLRSHMRVR
ncbi:hypothetical protein NKJ72_30750, partial [Mesorhizobium sp. M0045]